MALSVAAAPLLCEAQTIITTVADDGSSAFAAASGPALAEGMTPYSVLADKAGNLYIGNQALSWLVVPPLTWAPAFRRG